MSLTQKFSENNKVTMYAVVADHSADTDVGWVDATNYRKFAVGTVATLLTGVGIDKFEIEISAASNGASSTSLIQHAIGSAPDAVGDMLWLEVDLDDAAPGITGARYVNAILNAANAADDTAVVYILSEAKHKTSGLTADVVA